VRRGAAGNSAGARGGGALHIALQAARRDLGAGSLRGTIQHRGYPRDHRRGGCKLVLYSCISESRQGESPSPGPATNNS